jgi:hypothetical protein
MFNKVAPIYRLTDSGWSVMNRSQQGLAIAVFSRLSHSRNQCCIGVLPVF